MGRLGPAGHCRDATRAQGQGVPYVAVSPTEIDIAGDRPARVLVVDDEASIRNLLEALLAPQGYEVTVACDGDAAKLFLERMTFEVVITDYLIPGRLNGIDVLRFAKEMNAACQVVVITGNHGPEVQEKAIAFGAADYIPKPFSLGVISQAVANAAGR